GVDGRRAAVIVGPAAAGGSKNKGADAVLHEVAGASQRACKRLRAAGDVEGWIAVEHETVRDGEPTRRKGDRGAVIQRNKARARAKRCVRSDADRTARGDSGTARIGVIAGQCNRV